MRVDLHIDQLVLHEVAEADGPAVAAALRRRLAELISRNPPQWTDMDRVDAGGYPPGRSAEQTGANIAASVYKGVSNGGEPGWCPRAPASRAAVSTGRRDEHDLRLRHPYR